MTPISLGPPATSSALPFAVTNQLLSRLAIFLLGRASLIINRQKNYTSEYEHQETRNRKSVLCAVFVRLFTKYGCGGGTLLAIRNRFRGPVLKNRVKQTEGRRRKTVELTKQTVDRRKRDKQTKIQRESGQGSWQGNNKERKS
jgi:hypothetical protein